MQKSNHMNKRLVTIILSLAIAAVPAFAGIVTVDFGELGANTVDLNPASPNAIPPGTPYVITRLGFSYDPMGGSEQVSADTTGIFGSVAFTCDALNNCTPVGTLTGALTILFPYAVTGLSFTFTADGLPDVNGDPTINMVAGLFSPVDFGLSSLLSNPDGSATFGYGSLAAVPVTVDPFSKVDLYFGNGADSTAFSISSVQYDYTPEPVSFLLMGTGLVGLGCVRRFRRRS